MEPCFYFLYLSHLLYGICVNIFITNRYISRATQGAGAAVVSTITSLKQQQEPIINERKSKGNKLNVTARTDNKYKQKIETVIQFSTICSYNRRQNELRHFAQNWAFLRFTNFKRRKYSIPPPSPPCNVVPLFQLPIENNKHPNFEWRGQGRGADSFVLRSYPI